MRNSAIAILIALCAPLGVPAANSQPVYFYVSCVADDHINVEVTENRLNRALRTVEQLRTAHPQSGLSVLLLFSGATADVLVERDKSGSLMQHISQLVKIGRAEIGYRGTDEPTHRTRRVGDSISASEPEDRFRTRVHAIEAFLTYYRDPLRGSPEPKRSGGLKRLQEVFGEAAYVSGVNEDVGGDSDVAHVLGEFSADAMLPGIPEPDPGRNIHGYRTGATWFGRTMGAAPNAPPELYWQYGRLRLSETSEPSVRVVNGHEGPEPLRKILASLDRARAHVIQIRISDQRLHLAAGYDNGPLFPALRFAYDHPDRPRLPSGAVIAREELESRYALQDAQLKWLLSDFLPANPGSRFVSSKDLLRMARPNEGQSIPQQSLAEATRALLADWKTNNYPPNWAQADGRYFSLAEMFLMLAQSLAAWHDTGRLPETVRLGPVWGPIDLPEEAGPNQGHVTGKEMSQVCSRLYSKLSNAAWQPVPSNSIPPWLTVGENRVNAAQFLRLMAELVTNLSQDSQMSIRMCRPRTELTEMHPTNRPPRDAGGTWTLRPAPLTAGLKPD